MKQSSSKQLLQNFHSNTLRNSNPNSLMQNQTMVTKNIKNFQARSSRLVFIKASLVSALLVSPWVSAPLIAKTFDQPADSVQWRASELTGYSLALQKCTTCHSAHYAEYQPPSAGAAYWKAQVLRMKNVFKAPLTDEEAQTVVEYLSQNYGSARK